MPIFQLEWGSYDCSTEYYFDAPEGTTFEEFKALCDRLIRESAEDAMHEKGRHPLHQKRIEARKGWWLGYEYFVREVSARLPEHGYKEVKFQTAMYKHGDILGEYYGDKENGVLGDELAARVCVYNREKKEEIEEYRKKSPNTPPSFGGES
jgi:hypothetical protein